MVTLCHASRTRLRSSSNPARPNIWPDSSTGARGQPVGRTYLVFCATEGTASRRERVTADEYVRGQGAGRRLRMGSEGCGAV